MKFNPLAKTSVPLYLKSLNAYSLRQRGIAENIANIETRGYKPVKVSFEEQLRETLNRKRPKGRQTQPGHLEIGGTPAQVNPKIEFENRPVNLEDEMAELAKNQIRYEFVTRQLHGSFEAIHTAILGRLR